MVVPADRPGWHHRHPVRPGGAYELALIGHVQHRQRQPTAALQHRAFQRCLDRFGVGVVHVAGFVNTPQDALKGGERRQVDGIEAGAEQVGANVAVLIAVGRRALVKLDALVSVRCGRTLTCP